jgi:hypothetical protein
MNCLGLVFFLGLKDQLFQDGVGPRNNTDRMEAFSCGENEG